MKSVVNAIQKFVKEEDGATAVEYGVLIALIIAVLITVITTLGTSLNAKFNEVDSAL